MAMLLKHLRRAPAHFHACALANSNFRAAAPVTFRAAAPASFSTTRTRGFFPSPDYWANVATTIATTLTTTAANVKKEIGTQIKTEILDKKLHHAQVLTAGIIMNIISAYFVDIIFRARESANVLSNSVDNVETGVSGLKTLLENEIEATSELKLEMETTKYVAGGACVLSLVGCALGVLIVCVCRK